MYHVRSEAQRHRQMIVVLIGEDLSKLSPKPIAGVLPAQGRVEIWEMKTAGRGVGAMDGPWGWVDA